MTSPSYTALCGLTWFVIRTRSGRETRVVEHLRERGYRDLYLPTERRLRRTHKCTKPVDHALIPGLLFLGVGPATPPLYDVCAVPGVSELVRDNKGEAAAIRREADGYHAVYDFQARQASGEFDHTPRAKSWAKGDRVQITAGCFSGRIGEVLKAEPGQRAHILLSGLFAGKSGVPIDPKYLVVEPVQDQDEAA